MKVSVRSSHSQRSTLPSLCLSSSSKPPTWLSCPESYVSFPRNSREAGTWHSCLSTKAVQQGRGVHLPGQDVAGSVNPGARETDGAPALWRCPQTFMEHLLSVSHRRPSRGIQSARMDAALSEPTDRHRRRKWRPTQWAVGPGGSGGLLMPPGHIPSWGSPGCPRCSWDPDPQVRSSASGTASWRCRTPWGSGPRFLYQ